MFYEAKKNGKEIAPKFFPRHSIHVTGFLIKHFLSHFHPSSGLEKPLFGRAVFPGVRKTMDGSVLRLGCNQSHLHVTQMPAPNLIPEGCCCRKKIPVQTVGISGTDPAQLMNRITRGVLGWSFFKWTVFTGQASLLWVKLFMFSISGSRQRNYEKVRIYDKLSFF